MLNAIAILFYFAGTFAQAIATFHDYKIARNWFYILGSSAIILHGLLLYDWIDLSDGQNLTEYNLLSLATWTAALYVQLMSLKRSIGYLNIYIFPLAAISIFLASHYQGYHIFKTASDPRQLGHILISIITFSVLSLAGLQALTLAFREKFLKQKQVELSKALPPLETMEKQLFELIAVGALLLTVLLASSIYWFHPILLHSFLRKTILTCLAWLVFTSLLIGRRYFGWRGKKAVYCTLSGVAIVTVTYFSSLIIMELLP